MASKSFLIYLGTVVILMAGLLNVAVPMQVGGVNIKLHELMLISMSAIGFFVIFKTDLVTSMLLVAILTVFFVIGVAQNPVASVMRDMLQLLFFFSFFSFSVLSEKQFQSVDRLIIAVLVLVAPLAFTVGVANDFDRWQGVSFETQLLYNMRIPLLGLAVIVCFLLIGVRDAVYDFGRMNRLIIYTVTILILSSVFFVRTRGLFVSYFTIFSVVLMVAVYDRRRSSMLLAIAAGFSIMIFVYFYAVQFAGDERVLSVISFLRGDFSVLSTDYTMYLRLMFWEEAISKIKTIADVFFGVGFGSYLYLDPWGIGEWEMMPGTLIHNQLLSLFYNGGILVYVFIALYLNIIFRRCKRRLAMSVYAAGIVVYSFFTPLISDSIYASFMFYYLARHSFYNKVIE